MKQAILAIVTILLAALALHHLNTDKAQPQLKREPIDYLNIKAECTKKLEE
jgi:hypothetical protein